MAISVSNLISKDRLVEGFVYTSTMTQRLAQGGIYIYVSCSSANANRS